MFQTAHPIAIFYDNERSLVKLEQKGGWEWVVRDERTR